jgi:hypothetical protein
VHGLRGNSNPLEAALIHFRSLVPVVLALASCGLVSRSARADTMIAVDAEGAIPTTPSALLSGGGGFGVRLGEQLHLPLVRLTVEAGYAYAQLVKEDAPANWTIHRAQLGGRLGLGELIVASLFAHGGYGWRFTHDDSYGGGGFAYDAGLAVDLNLGFLSLGVHGAYNHVDAQPVPPQWISLGVDAAVVF